MQKRVFAMRLVLAGLISNTGVGGKDTRVVLFVSLNSFIDIQNRYLLNVENMTVGGDTKEPRESGPQDTQRVFCCLARGEERHKEVD